MQSLRPVRRVAELGSLGHFTRLIMNATQTDIAMRWLTIGLCVPIFVIGFWGLVLPHTYQKALVGLSGRVPDQKAIAPFVRFLNGRYFIPLLRAFSLFPIGLAVAILLTLR